MLRSLLIATILLGMSTVLQAHAHLTASVPAEGSSAAAPQRLELTFSEPAVLTALTLQSPGAAPIRLTDLPRTSAPHVTVPLPSLPAASYTVKWRVLAADGHVMAGVLHFRVTAPR